MIIDELMFEIVMSFVSLCDKVTNAAKKQSPSANLNGSGSAPETLWQEFVYRQQGELPISTDCQEAIRVICQQVIASEQLRPKDMLLFWLDTRTFENWEHDGGDAICFSLAAMQQDLVDELFVKVSDLAHDYDQFE